MILFFKRIILFPIFLWAIWYRKKHQVGPTFEVKTDDYFELQVAEPEPEPEPTRWTIEVFNDKGVLIDKQSATIDFDRQGFVVHVCLLATKPFTTGWSQVRKDGVIYGLERLLTRHVLPNDYLNIEHRLRIVDDQKKMVWYGKKVDKLDNKHLYNIVKGIMRGHWSSYDKPVNVLPELEKAVLNEFSKRGYTDALIEDIYKVNKEWEAKRAS